MNTTKEKRVKSWEIFKKYWYHSGNWHNAECSFLLNDNGVCNCNYKKNRDILKKILKQREEELERKHKEEMRKEIKKARELKDGSDKKIGKYVKTFRYTEQELYKKFNLEEERNGK